MSLPVGPTTSILKAIIDRKLCVFFSFLWASHLQWFGGTQHDSFSLFVFSYSCISVLIDDRVSARDPWERAGGLFIHHVNTETTLIQLREQGIL